MRILIIEDDADTSQFIARGLAELGHQVVTSGDGYLAAKEAAVKALGTGIGNGISWQHIEVRNNDFGAPELHFSGEFAMMCQARGITRSVVSISDEQHYAVATVILEST